jgi:hypothetical protein
LDRYALQEKLRAMLDERDAVDEELPEESEEAEESKKSEAEDDWPWP